jgi:hypothetical protein
VPHVEQKRSAGSSDAPHPTQLREVEDMLTEAVAPPSLPQAFMVHEAYGALFRHQSRPSNMVSRPTVPPPSPSADRMNEAELLYAVRDAAAGVYEVIGEVGRTERGTIVFLAREIATATVVALRLEPSGDDEAGVPQFSLDVLRELDESVPSLEGVCPKCSKPIRKWARFCTKCGQDVTGISPSQSGASVSRVGLRQDAERVAAASGYQFIGEMPRAAGGGAVYFARDPRENRVVALRLTKEGDRLGLGVTGVMQPVELPTGRPSPGSVGIVPGKTVRTAASPAMRPAALASPAAAAPMPNGNTPERRRSTLWLLIAAVVVAGALVAYGVIAMR